MVEIIYKKDGLTLMRFMGEYSLSADHGATRVVIEFPHAMTKAFIDDVNKEGL